MNDYLTADHIKILLRRINQDFGPFVYRFAVPVFRTKRELIEWVYLYMEGDPYTRSFGPIGSWDVSLIQDFSLVFSRWVNPKMRDFNEDLSGWNMSNATNMHRMFHGCESFNQDLSQWNTSLVADMREMFAGCVSFNGDVSGWNTRSVRNMARMFWGCISFNQDVSGWDTRSVRYMKQMFQGCTLFNQDLSSWDTTSVLSRRGMFDGCTSLNPSFSPH